MEATNRTNKHKLKSIDQAFTNLKKYELQDNNFCEVKYNIARAFTHINRPDFAIKILREARRKTECEIVELNVTLRR